MRYPTCYEQAVKSEKVGVVYASKALCEGVLIKQRSLGESH